MITNWEQIEKLAKESETALAYMREHPLTHEQAVEQTLRLKEKVKDIAKICYRFLDGEFGEIVPNRDDENAPFSIVTNIKTGKWFRAKKWFFIKTTGHANHSVDITFSITPNDIKDTIPVIGIFRSPLPDCLLKEELVGDNKKLHIEIFNADKVKQDEYFLYNAWISGINFKTNEIVLSCDWVE